MVHDFHILILPYVEKRDHWSYVRWSSGPRDELHFLIQKLRTFHPKEIEGRVYCGKEYHPAGKQSSAGIVGLMTSHVFPAFDKSQVL